MDMNFILKKNQVAKQESSLPVGTVGFHHNPLQKAVISKYGWMLTRSTEN